MPTAIEFFKLLPKTNCKDCGQPTCLAFAMLLANQKAKIDDCPHIKKESKDALSEASAPPVRTVSIGPKGKGIEMGGETVLYRHERRFVNQTAYAVTVSDSLDTDAIKERIKKIGSLRFERVGLVFDIDLISIKNESGITERYLDCIRTVTSEWDRPFILECDNADILAEALNLCRSRRPLIYAADDDNVDFLASLSKDSGCPLAVRCSDIDDAVVLTEKAKKLGIEDLVLDLGSKNLKECLERQTVARRSALKKKFKPLGYPLMNRVGSGEYAVATAVISTLKYGSLVIFDDLSSYEALPLFTLRQNIYTDPQVPIQVKQGLYPIGNPDEHSPIMFTTNFSLTYFTVRADIEKSKIPVWLQTVNTEGLSVLTAYAAGKFDPEHVKEALDESGVLTKSNGIVVVPGLVSRMSGKLQELIKRDVIVGTTESKNIPKHLKEITS
ncbi:MAG: acetyl-CoA decarbonylase/synthase complex subunit gamma [Candidatus Methanomethylophilaceae archaeon]